MDVLFVGADGAFSFAALQALLRSSHRVIGVVTPDPKAGQLLPVLSADHTIITLSWAHHLPLWGLGDAPAAEVIAVACFPKRLPASFLQRARRAAVNIHPSHLPHYRGPAPLFWQLRDGVAPLGVTLHHLASELDTGDIVSQTDVALPEGVGGLEADALLAEAGAGLLVRALDKDDFGAAPQTGAGSYQSWPGAADWRVPPEWPVQRAFNFMRGTEEWGHAYTLPTRERLLQVTHASHYTLGEAQPGASRPNPHGWAVGFADGWLHVS